ASGTFTSSGLATHSASSRFANSVLTKETVSDLTTSSTAAQFVGGIITISCAGGAVNHQLPTAANLVAAVSGVAVGDVIKCLIVAYGHATNAVTLTTNTGLTLLGNNVTFAASSKLVYARFTNVTSSSEA